MKLAIANRHLNSRQRTFIVNIKMEGRMQYDAVNTCKCGRTKHD
jgi:hypothetical protein